MEVLIFLAVIGSSIWVALDAQNLGAGKNGLRGIAGTSAGAWFFGCLLLWIVFFPLYLSQRSKLVEAASYRTGPLRAQHPGVIPPPPKAAVAPPSSPPGWLPDPRRRHEHRYWDGRAWTDHVADAGQASTDPV